MVNKLMWNIFCCNLKERALTWQFLDGFYFLHEQFFLRNFIDTKHNCGSQSATRQLYILSLKYTCIQMYIYLNTFSLLQRERKTCAKKKKYSFSSFFTCWSVCIMTTIVSEGLHHFYNGDLVFFIDFIIVFFPLFSPPPLGNSWEKTG